MITVLSVVGTRPEAIKMAPVITALNDVPHLCRSVVCSTGQHREILDQVFKLFGVKPDYDLDIMRPNQSLADLTQSIISGVTEVLRCERPDWVLVQGDTTTAMASALSAFYSNIRIGHVEAGLRTGNKHQPFPEEVNRRIISLVADLHFAPTEAAAQNLYKEHIPRECVRVTGNTVIDSIQLASKLPFDPADSPLACVAEESRRIIVVTAHRRENFGTGIEAICEAILRISQEVPDVCVVYPVHPNPNIREPVSRLLAQDENVTLLEPLGYREMAWLLSRATMVLTDSGGLQEEAPGLGIPVLVLRETTERPESIEAATAKLVGVNVERIVSSVQNLLEDKATYARMASARNPYGDGAAAVRIRDAILVSGS